MFKKSSISMVTSYFKPNCIRYHGEDAQKTFRPGVCCSRLQVPRNGWGVFLHVAVKYVYTFMQSDLPLSILSKAHSLGQIILLEHNEACRKSKESCLMN